MNADEVVRLLEARPFRPFVVHLPIPEVSVYVDDPRLARVDAESETMYFTQHPAEDAERWDEIIDLRLVAVIQLERSK